MSDVDSERIDEMVTDVSVWIGRTAVGAMEDLYERDALLELQRLGKLAKDLLVKLAAVSDTSEQWQVRCAGCLCAAEGATGEQFAAKQGDYGWTPAYQKTLELRREFDQLRAELASIQDAGDEEIDSLRHKVNYLYLPESEEDSAALDALESVAKARGQKIAEQAAENERLKEMVDAVDGDPLDGRGVRRLCDEIRNEARPYTSKLDDAVTLLSNIAIGRGVRMYRMQDGDSDLIRERDEAIAKLANETKLYIGANEAQKQREISACERAKIPYGGCDTVHDLADVVEELRREVKDLDVFLTDSQRHTKGAWKQRDEAIGLLKCLAVLCGVGLIEYHANHGDPQAKRILELTAK